MQFDNTFTVTAPLERVWPLLMNFQEVTGCVPGAEVLNKLSEDAYQVGMKVKLGPVTMAYRGQLEVLERDEAGHRAVLKGQAKEARGQGTAQATVVLQLSEEAGSTHGSVSADVAISGRAAAMGQGVIGSVADQMMAQFAENLQVMLDEAGPMVAPVSPASGSAAAVPSANGAGAEDLVAPPASTVVDPTPSAASAAPSPVQRPAAVGGDSLDAMALARGMAQAQLQDPQRVLQLLAVVALLAYRVGKGAARRERARAVAELSALAVSVAAAGGVGRPARRP